MWTDLIECEHLILLSTYKDPAFAVLNAQRTHFGNILERTEKRVWISHARMGSARFVRTWHGLTVMGFGSSDYTESVGPGGRRYYNLGIDV